MQIEHEWKQYSEKHPGFRFPELPHQWKPLNFWNARKAYPIFLLMNRG